MYTAQTLEIRGYRDEAVPHTFWRQDTATRRLAVLLPGVDYSAEMPLLYYPARLLLSRGVDVLRVEYAYGRRPDFATLPQAERSSWLFGDATAAWRAALAQRSYEHVAFVGKSLGTLAMGHLLTAGDTASTTTGGAPASAAGGAAPVPVIRAVWLTPLLRHMHRQIEQWGGPSLFVIGTADPFYDPVLLERVQRATGGEAVVIDGADHALETNDVLQSLAAMEQVMRALQHFLFADA